MIDLLAGFSVLAVMSVAYLTSVERIERLRLVVTNRHVCTVLGVFTFAGVVTLPFLLLVTLVAIAYAAAWPAFRNAGMPAWRWVYNGAQAAVACVSAAWVLGRSTAQLGKPLALLCAIGAFVLLNLILTAGAISAARHWASLAVLRRPQTYWLLLTTQACGAVVGVCMEWHPALGVVGLPVLAAIHSDAVKATLRQAKAVSDDGICSRHLWLYFAQEADRSGEWYSTIVVETAAGEAQSVALEVLKSHARAASPVAADGIARSADVVGVYSSTQLVLLRHFSPLPMGHLVSHRIRADLQTLGVDVAVGVADSKQGAIDAALALANAEIAVDPSGSAMSAPPDLRPDHPSR